MDTEALPRVVGESAGHGGRTWTLEPIRSQVQISAFPLTGWATLGKLLNFLESQYPLPQKEGLYLPCKVVVKKELLLRS